MIKDIFIPVPDPGKFVYSHYHGLFKHGGHLCVSTAFTNSLLCSCQKKCAEPGSESPWEETSPQPISCHGSWAPWSLSSPGGCDCPRWSPCSCCFTDPCRDTVTPLFPSPFMQQARVRPFHHEHCRPFCSQDVSSYIFSIFEPFTLLFAYKYTVIFPLIIGEQQSWIVILISWQESEELFIW